MTDAGSSIRSTILCIEDEVHLLEELSEELVATGYVVLAASSGEQAEAILRNSAPDIVVCDVLLPRRSGFDLVRDWQLSGLLSGSVAVIFLTALSGRERRLEGMRCGAVAYLSKPIDLELLHLTIRNHIDLVDRSRGGALRDTVECHLTAREKQVLARIGQGERTTVIAQSLGISEYTVNQHVKEVYRKLNLNNRAAATRAAISLRLV